MTVPAATSRSATMRYRKAGFISTSLREFRQLRQCQLEQQRRRPKRDRHHGEWPEPQLVGAVLLHLYPSGRSCINLLDRPNHVVLGGGGIKAAARLLQR